MSRLAATEVDALREVRAAARWDHDHSKCGPMEQMGYASLHHDEWGDDLDVADWLVWYARKNGGKSRDVAQRALEEYPALRFSERLGVALAETASSRESELQAALEDIFRNPSRYHDVGAVLDALRPLKGSEE